MKGSVVDQTGGGVAGSRINLLNAGGRTIQAVEVTHDGSFSLPALAKGSYTLLVEAPGFEPKQVVLTIPPKQNDPLRITLGIAELSTQVTVTASRGLAEDTTDSARLVTVRTRDVFGAVPNMTIGHALDASPGVMLQQTAPGQVSPHLRGLTGYQTLLLADSIRFNTSLFRSGPNQYLSFLEPGAVQGVEAVLGPTATTFGSDAMGGAINVLSLSPHYADSPKWEFHGELRGMGGYADASAAGDTHVMASTRRVSLAFGGAMRRFNNLRPGEGLDSRNAFQRFLGTSPDLARSLMGDRVPDTGLTQYGGDTKLAFRLGDDQNLTIRYVYDGIKGERPYRDRLGGAGRVVSDFNPQRLNFGYVRYDRQRLGFLDSLSGTFSVNSQRDGTHRGGLRFTDVITRDDSRVDAYGYSAQGSTHIRTRQALIFGGEYYDEHITSYRFLLNPATRARTQDRPLYPNGSRYGATGAFLQDNLEFLRGRVRAMFGLRYTGNRFRAFADRNIDGSGRPLGVIDSSRRFHDLTFNGSMVVGLTQSVAVTGVVGRGFRAPNAFDLSSIGLTTLGYDVPIAAVIEAGGLAGLDSSDNPLPRTRPLSVLKAETLYSYELGLRYKGRRIFATAHVFDAELYDPIVARTVLFRAGSAPARLAGVNVAPIAQTPAQAAAGVVSVATPFSPRSVKAAINDGQSKYYGTEALLQAVLTSRWSLDANYSFMAGRELYPNRPARRLPPQAGLLTIRYARSRYWAAADFRATGAQRRLSGADIDDERIGASRRRTDIRDFFNSDNVRPYLAAGADGRFGTADDLFRPTNETLLQIQDRVLPLNTVVNGVRVASDAVRIPFHRETAGWATLGFRSGLRIGERSNVFAGVSNVFDKSYRMHGSGIDAPGVNVFFGFKLAF
jgi:outer membrane receptor protein involved in Fe transport